MKVKPEHLELHREYGKLVVLLFEKIGECKGLDIGPDVGVDILLAQAEEFFDGLSTTDQRRLFCYGAVTAASMMFAASEIGLIKELLSRTHIQPPQENI